MTPALKIYDSFHDLYKNKYCGDRVDQFSLIMKIADYAQERTGRLVYNGKDMTCSDIANCLGRKKDKVAMTITDLISNGVILCFDGAYFFNPQYIETCFVSDKDMVELMEGETNEGKD